MNHLGDANKMVSDTPRTEAVNQYLRTRRDYTKTDHEVWMNHGIQIERELNAANESFRKLNIHALNLVDRIRRLEEAGDALLELCEADESKFHLADHIDARCEQWIKTKEAKP